MTDIFRKDYRPLTEEEQQLMDDIKDGAQNLHDLIGRAESVGTAGEAITIAKNHLKEAVFWAIHGITG